MPVRGIRGATTVNKNEAAAIYAGTLEVLQTIVKLNGVRADDVAYVWFTVTEDLDAAFPADAARAGLGWTTVPLICGREIPVPALSACACAFSSSGTRRRPRRRSVTRSCMARECCVRRGRSICRATLRSDCPRCSSS